MSNLPNTTQVPNFILDKLMQELKNTELRIMLLVTRQTLGWVLNKETGMRKAEDWISGSQIRKKINRSSKPISDAIDSLIKKEYLEARDKKGNLLNTKTKRRGKRIYYRLGKEILGTCLESKEVKTQPVYKVKFRKQITTKGKTHKNSVIYDNTAEPLKRKLIILYAEIKDEQPRFARNGKVAGEIIKDFGFEKAMWMVEYLAQNVPLDKWALESVARKLGQEQEQDKAFKQQYPKL